MPTPHALALCDDTDILGTRFWVYDYVDGHTSGTRTWNGLQLMSDLCYIRAGPGGGDAARGGASIKISRGAGGSAQSGLPRAAGQDWTRQYQGADEKLGVATDARVADHADRLRSACETVRQMSLEMLIC